MLRLGRGQSLTDALSVNTDSSVVCALKTSQPESFTDFYTSQGTSYMSTSGGGDIVFGSGTPRTPMLTLSQTGTTIHTDILIEGNLNISNFTVNDVITSTGLDVGDMKLRDAYFYFPGYIYLQPPGGQIPSGISPGDITISGKLTSGSVDSSDATFSGVMTCSQYSASGGTCVFNAGVNISGILNASTVFVNEDVEIYGTTTLAETQIKGTRDLVSDVRTVLNSGNILNGSSNFGSTLGGSPQSIEFRSSTDDLKLSNTSSLSYHDILCVQDSRVMGIGTLNPLSDVHIVSGARDRSLMIDIVPFAKSTSSNFPAFLIRNFTGSSSNYKVSAESKMFVQNTVGVSRGDGFCIKIDNASSVYGWGNNNHGQLGNYDEKITRYAKNLDPSGTGTPLSISEVCAGRSHTGALTVGGLLYLWGTKEKGETGRTPSEYSGGNLVWEHIGLGDGYTVALETGGAVYCWGSIAESDVPVIVSGVSGAIHLSCSKDVFYALTDTNQVYKIESPTNVVNITPQLEAVSPVGTYPVCLAASSKNVGVLFSSGDIVVYGNSNEHGEFCVDPSTTPVTVYTASLVISGEDIVAISSGETHFLVIKRNGYVLSWGSNIFGQLGRVSATPWIPDKVRDDNANTVSFINAFDQSSSSLVNLLDLSNTSNVPFSFSRGSPRLVRGAANHMLGSANFSSNTSSVLLESGKLFIWGKNQSSELGVVSSRDSLVPVRPRMTAFSGPMDDPNETLNIEEIFKIERSGDVTVSGRSVSNIFQAISYLEAPKAHFERWNTSPTSGGSDIVLTETSLDIGTRSLNGITSAVADNIFVSNITVTGSFNLSNSDLVITGVSSAKFNFKNTTNANAEILVENPNGSAEVESRGEGPGASGILRSSYLNGTTNIQKEIKSESSGVKDTVTLNVAGTTYTETSTSTHILSDTSGDRLLMTISTNPVGGASSFLRTAVAVEGSYSTGGSVLGQTVRVLGDVYQNDFSSKVDPSISIDASYPYSREIVFGPGEGVAGNLLTVRGNTYVGGTLTTTTGTVQASDSKLKTNVVPLDTSEAKDFIGSLNPVKFDWIQNKGEDVGFIAQEVNNDLVTDQISDSVLGIKMDRIIPYLVAEVKRLREEIDTIKMYI